MGVRGGGWEAGSLTEMKKARLHGSRSNVVIDD